MLRNSIIDASREYPASFIGAIDHIDTTICTTHSVGAALDRKYDIVKLQSNKYF
jgi:hypothetical protein